MFDERRRTMAKVIGPTDGKAGSLGGIGARLMIFGEETGERFSLVEHPMPPRSLAAPMHRHSREDEYSYVIEGRIGAVLGDEVVYAEVGDLVYKPRNQWHTFWNAGDTPCRILEIIAQPGFEHFFNELGEAMAAVDAPNPGVVLATSDLPERYAIEFQPERIADICQTYGLRFPGVID